MCGILGIINRKIDKNYFLHLLDLLNHRGPDETGFYIENEIFLGHKRLSIVDIEGGHQPMFSKDKEIGIIFNGEIYNFKYLRNILESKGYIFHTTHSDTEVLIYGYREWGINLLNKLNGMFAFAIYNKKEKYIFLARDRFGQKPLYYTNQHGIFMFSSELTPIKQANFFNNQIDDFALIKFLAYSFLPAPYSIYKNVYKLEPGHYLIYKIKENKLYKQKYWEFNIEADKSLNKKKPDKIEEEFSFLLENAVKRRLLSDVPVSVFLSGGIDSSTILYYTLKNSNNKINSFSIGFNNKSFDETYYIKLISSTLKAENNLKFFTEKELFETINVIQEKLDDLLGDVSILPTYLLANFTSRTYKVALGGDGADELLLGYDTFKALLPSLIYSKIIPNKFHKLIRKFINNLPVSHNNMSFDFKLKRTLMGLSYNRNLWNSVWLAPLEIEEIEKLFQRKVRLDELYSETIDIWNNSKSDNIYDKSSEIFVKLYLAEDILMKIDRASMMNSLEVRSPFLDIELVNFIRRLPLKYRFSILKNNGKQILKKVSKNFLPDEIINRKKKGFGVPISQWIYNGIVDFDIKENIYFDVGYFQNILNLHNTRTVDNKLALWCFKIIEKYL